MRRPALLAAIGLAAGLVLRLALIAATDYTPTADAAAFDRHGVSIASGEGYPEAVLAEGPSAFRPPGMPAMLAAIYGVSGTTDTTSRWTLARVVQSLLAVGAAALVGLVALRLWGDRRIAALATALAAVFPASVMWSNTLLSEPLFVVLVLSAVIAMLAFRREPGRMRWIALSGVLVGLATLTRPNGIVLLVPVVVAAWVRRPRWALRSLVPPAAAVLAALAVVAPWSARNTLTFDRFVPVHTETGFALAGTYNDEAARRTDCPACFVWFIPPEYLPLVREPGLDEVEVEERVRSAAIAYARAHPVYVGKVVLWNTFRMLGGGGIGLERKIARQASAPGWLPWPSLLAFYAVAAVAAAGLVTRRIRAIPAAVWLVPALLFASVLPILGNSRYRAPVDPFVILLAAAAFVAWRDRLGSAEAAPA